MNIVLLSGGSGKRLWPLSNEIRSKQFIKIFKSENGYYESMIQRVFRQIKHVDINARVIIATSKTQVSALKNQLGNDIGISIEPCRRDTFPAISLAVAYLHDIQNVSESEQVVICPVDPYVDSEYFESIKALNELAKKSSANIMLMGITPDYPSEKYGYIIPETDLCVSKVKTFKEKPNKEKAKEYLSCGALWNAGVFAFRIGYILDICKTLFGTSDYYELFANYSSLEKISFDYAVVEKEKQIEVMRFSGKWKDLGTWDTLTEAMQESSVGTGVVTSNCDNTYVINELNIPIICSGLKNIVVTVAQDGILVSDLNESCNIKNLVESVEHVIRFAEKSWGDYRVLDISDNSMTVKITIKPHHKMSYHSHNLRNEVWVIMRGSGISIVDGMLQGVKEGDVIAIQAGCRHTIIAGDETLEIIEVQLGKDISEDDKQKYELEY